MKYYAVKVGRKTGILESWEECSKSVYGFPGAVYKSFKTCAEADQYLNREEAPQAGKEEAEVRASAMADPNEKSENPDSYVLAGSAKAYVDGSYLAATGDFSYGCVVLIGDTEIRLYEKMTDPELSAMHNVAGEIKGAEAAMRFAVANGIPELTIYHDYEGIARWCTGDWTATKPGTIAYSSFYQSLPRGLRVKFVKVQGHSGDKYNDLADRLAKFALGIT